MSRLSLFIVLALLYTTPIEAACELSGAGSGITWVSTEDREAGSFSEGTSRPFRSTMYPDDSCADDAPRVAAKTGSMGLKMVDSGPTPALALAHAALSVGKAPPQPSAGSTEENKNLEALPELVRFEHRTDTENTIVVSINNRSAACRVTVQLLHPLRATAEAMTWSDRWGSRKGGRSSLEEAELAYFGGPLFASTVKVHKRRLKPRESWNVSYTLPDGLFRVRVNSEGKGECGYSRTAEFGKAGEFASFWMPPPSQNVLTVSNFWDSAVATRPTPAEAPADPWPRLSDLAGRQIDSSPDPNEFLFLIRESDRPIASILAESADSVCAYGLAQEIPGWPANAAKVLGELAAEAWASRRSNGKKVTVSRSCDILLVQRAAVPYLTFTSSNPFGYLRDGSITTYVRDEDRLPEAIGSAAARDRATILRRQETEFFATLNRLSQDPKSGFLGGIRFDRGNRVCAVKPISEEERRALLGYEDWLGRLAEHRGTSRSSERFSYHESLSSLYESRIELPRPRDFGCDVYLGPPDAVSQIVARLRNAGRTVAWYGTAPMDTQGSAFAFTNSNGWTAWLLEFLSDTEAKDLWAASRSGGYDTYSGFLLATEMRLDASTVRRLASLGVTSVEQYQAAVAEMRASGYWDQSNDVLQFLADRHAAQQKQSVSSLDILRARKSEEAARAQKVRAEVALIEAQQAARAQQIRAQQAQRDAEYARREVEFFCVSYINKLRNSAYVFVWHGPPYTYAYAERYLFRANEDWGDARYRAWMRGLLKEIFRDPTGTERRIQDGTMAKRCVSAVHGR